MGVLYLRGPNSWLPIAAPPAYQPVGTHGLRLRLPDGTWVEQINASQFPGTPLRLRTTSSQWETVLYMDAGIRYLEIPFISRTYVYPITTEAGQPGPNSPHWIGATGTTLLPGGSIGPAESYPSPPFGGVSIGNVSSNLGGGYAYKQTGFMVVDPRRFVFDIRNRVESQFPGAIIENITYQLGVSGEIDAGYASHDLVGRPLTVTVTKRDDIPTIEVEAAQFDVEDLGIGLAYAVRNADYQPPTGDVMYTMTITKPSLSARAVQSKDGVIAIGTYTLQQFEVMPRYVAQVSVDAVPLPPVEDRYGANISTAWLIEYANVRLRLSNT